MDVYADFAGRLLADRYRLPRPPSESPDAGQRGDLGEAAAVVAFDTASDQEVLVRQIPLPEIVEAEVVDAAVAGGRASGGRGGVAGPRGPAGRATRRPADPTVRRAVEAAWAAAQLPDHPRLDQVYDVFVEGDGLWVVSELVPARPLSALLAKGPLTAYRAAEIAEDLLAALRTVHAHGWIHRNITPETVLVCDDGRALLTGLATGAAEEALCGYDPVPPRSEPNEGGAVGPDGANAARDAEAATVESGRAERGVGGASVPGAGAELWAPATWSGSALPEGFAARQDAGPEGFGRRANERLDGRWEEHRGPGALGFGGTPAEDRPSEDGTADTPGAAPCGGSADEWGVPAREFEPGAPPVRHGYETYELKAGDEGSGRGGAPHEDEGLVHTGGTGEPCGPGYPGDLGDVGAEARLRATRRGAIAAYRAGARRAAEMRAADRETARRAGEGGNTAGNGDWWSAAPSREEAPPYSGQLGQEKSRTVPEASPVPDEDVRWLPPSGDVVSPATLPGARTGGSRSARTTGEAAAGEGSAAIDEGATEAAPAGAELGAGAAAEESGSTGSADAFEGAAGQGGLPREYGEVSGAGGGGQSWGGEPAGNGDRHPGATTALAAERARHARMTAIGPVTERWAPEQAGTVHPNWRLAPPVGPEADLWALGALLFRAVQGHAPYPEESAAELVQMVCAEPPAFAEECGPLRPVVESLMRQDPTERPDSEELRGWLRSLVRSAPEPEAGRRTVVAPLSLERGGPSDPRRLPILRRRGELVRRRRGLFTARSRRETRTEESPSPPKRRRHKRRRGGPEHHRPPPQAAAAKPSIGPEPLTGPAPSMATEALTTPDAARAPHSASEPGTDLGPEPVRGTEAGQPRGVQPLLDSQPLAEQQPFTLPEPVRARRAPKPPRPPKPPPALRASRTAGNPRGFGRWLVGLVLFGMTAGVLYALWFLPQGNAGNGDHGAPQRGSVEAPGAAPSSGQGGGAKDKGSVGAEKSRRTAPAVQVPEGFRLSKDPAGFRIAVPEDWNRRTTPGEGQVRYSGGQVELVIVKGRDTTGKYGEDPTEYQADDEPELSAYRASDWATASGLRRIDVGETSMAEGAFGWQHSGRQVYARNRAMVLDGRYHVLLVMGSEEKKEEIDRVFEAVAETYRVTR